MSEDAETAGGWSLLARIVRARRKRLGLTQQDLTSRGPSISTVQAVEAATPVAARTLNKLDESLRWPSATARTIVFANDSTALEQWEDFLTYCVHEVCDDHVNLTIYDVLLARRSKQDQCRKEAGNELFLRELRHLNMALADADYQHSTLVVEYPELQHSFAFNRLFSVIQEVRGTLRDWHEQYSQQRSSHGVDRENEREG